MIKLLDWMRKHKIISSILILLIFAIPLGIVPILYKVDCKITWLQSAWDSGDLLAYIAGFEAFIGTVSLGLVTVWQNQRAYNISDRMLEIEEQRILPYIDINREKSKVTKIDENTLKIKLWLTNYSKYPVHNIYLSKTKLNIREIHELYNCDGVDNVINLQLSNLPEWQSNGKEKENENYILTTIAGLREISVEHFQKGKLVETEYFPNSESLYFNEEIKNADKPIGLFLYMQNIKYDIFEQETKLFIIKRKENDYFLTTHSKKISLVKKSEEGNNG